MDNYYYMELEFLEDKSELILPRLIRLLPGSLKEKVADKYIADKLPLLEKETKLYKREGITVKLPYLKKEFTGLDRERQIEILSKVLSEYPGVPVSAPAKLEWLLPPGTAPKGTALMLAMMELIFMQLLRERKIPKKEMKLVCMDRPDLDILGLLEKWETDLNFLTIVTDRPEYYREFADRLFEETGLLVSFFVRPLSQQLYGNLVLDFGRSGEREYLYYPKGASVVDLSEDPERMRPILAKRKDIRYYNRLYLKQGSREVDAGLIEAALNITGILSEDRERKILEELSSCGTAYDRAGVKRFL